VDLWLLRFDLAGGGGIVIMNSMLVS